MVNASDYSGSYAVVMASVEVYVRCMIHWYLDMTCFITFDGLSGLSTF